jgi:methylated-DNA-[protein]-cysteine S-methyltransferase
MRALSCGEVVQQLPLLVIGDLSADEEQELDFHGLDCPECAADIAESRRLAGVINRIPTLDDVDARVALALPLLRARIMSALPRPAGFDRIDSPLGPLFVVVSANGLCAVRFHETEEGIEGWAQEHGLALSLDPAAVRLVSRELQEYFGRERTTFDLPIDLATVTPFVERVLRATAQVPFGRLASYKSIARDIGEPGATRAVGNALGHNPVPIVIPCHRVIRSDGSLGGYTGGTSIKRHLLSLEGSLLMN